MFNSGILDVVIGLAFVFSLLSLVSTALNELIESWLKMRSVGLERGIREMLMEQTDPDDTNWIRKLFSFLPGRGGAPADKTKETKDTKKPDMVQQLYEHPMIFSLFEGSYTGARENRKLPDYIPSRSFALALMDVILPATASTSEAAPQASGATGATVQTSGLLQSLRVARSALTDEKDKQLLEKLIYRLENDTSDTPDASSPGNTPIKALREAIGRSSATPEVKQALMMLVDAAGNDIVQARRNIEGWFDSSMDRVSGWYKRRVQWITLFLGLVLVGLTNIDTIAIANSLYTNADMRDSLVAAAQEYAKADSAQPDAQSSGAQACTSPECRIANNLDEIQSLGLPLGWKGGELRGVLSTPQGWVSKVLGLVLTALAISLGAPFWFDLLNKFVVIRSTVRPTEKSPEEPPVDR
jgi:hypothetical protein